VAIPDTICLSSSGIASAEIVRLVLPTVFGNRNALAASLSIKGMAHISGSGTGSMSCKFIKAQVSLSVSNLGAITVATDAQFTGATANTNAAGNDIASLSISALRDEGGQYVRVVATPVLSGANKEPVAFLGTARLHWAGNESRAPKLQTLV
jgi:hypothetical protein